MKAKTDAEILKQHSPSVRGRAHIELQLDYSTSLETFLAPVNELANFWGD